MLYCIGGYKEDVNDLTSGGTALLRRPSAIWIVSYSILEELQRLVAVFALSVLVALLGGS